MKNPILARLNISLENETALTETIVTPETEYLATVPAETTASDATVATATAPVATATPATDTQTEMQATEPTDQIETLPAATATVIPDDSSLSETVPVSETSAISTEEGEDTNATISTAPTVDVAADLPPTEAMPVEAPVEVPGAVEDVVAPMVDTEVEYRVAEQEVEGASDAVDVLYGAAVALEEIAEALPEILISVDDENVVKIAIASATAPLGDEFSETVSVENISEKVQEVWKAVLAAIKAFFKKVMDFLTSSKNRNKANREKLDAAISKMKDVNVRYVKGEMSVSWNGTIIEVSTKTQVETPSSQGVTALEALISSFNVNVRKTHQESLDIISTVKKNIAEFKKVEKTKVPEAITVFKSFPTDNIIHSLFDAANQKDFTKTKEAESSSGTANEAKLVSTFKKIESLLDDASKAGDNMEAKFKIIDVAREELLKEAADVDNVQVMNFIRTSVMASIMKVEQMIITQYADIQRALNTQSSVATLIVSRMGHMAATA